MGSMMERILFDKNKTEHSMALGNSTAQLRWKEPDDCAELTIELAYSHVYGMGEKYNAVSQKGLTVVNEVEEKFCYQGEKTYCPAPFFFTDTGFGLYADTACKTVFDFTGKHIKVTLPSNTPIVVFKGEPKEIISEYMNLLGVAKLPPKWAFGPWISANSWNTQEQVEQQIENVKKYQFPATVLVVEAWSDEATFYIFNGASYQPVEKGDALKYDDFDFSHSDYWKNPKAMIERLHQAGIHLVLWQIPVYKKQGNDEILNEQNELDRADAVERKLCIHNSDGTPYTIPEGHWFAGSMIPDFTNQDTCAAWFNKRQYLLDIGVDGFKTDGGEFIYRPEVSFKNGMTGKEAKNRYAQSYTEAYTSFIGEDHVLFSRAGFTGQHTTPILWGGDQQSTNDELNSVLRAGLSAALTGIPFWGFDIAGFAGALPTLDLYRRATQIACFCPVMQWHSEPNGGQFKELMPGYDGNNERSPWNLAAVYNEPQFIDEMRFWHNLRMNLLPYLYSEALKCVKQAKPMMRPLVYDWCNDRIAAAVEDEFMLGDSLLIAPFLEENSHQRKVYLPQGEWVCLFTLEVLASGEHNVACNKKQLPVYIKSGCGIALNLNENKMLGSSVGNRTDSYHHLHILLAGSKGSYTFQDDLGNDFTLNWDNGRIEKSGKSAMNYTYELIG